jgi:hypothetical protein
MKVGTLQLLAITPYAGPKKLVDMTENCISQLMECELPEGWEANILAVNNNAERQIRDFEDKNRWKVHNLNNDKNYGFGVGVNRGIDYWIYAERWHFDQLLIFNNDLEFPHKNWLVELMKHIEWRYVLSPCTDITATFDATEFEPRPDKEPKRHREVSAFCWLVPRAVIDAIARRMEYPLFCPQFSNYGSDDAAAAILRFLYGDTPFKIVPASWVKHLKAQTAKELGEKAGTKQLLTDLKLWKSKNKFKK